MIGNTTGPDGKKWRPLRVGEKVEDDDLEGCDKYPETWEPSERVEIPGNWVGGSTYQVWRPVDEPVSVISDLKTALGSGAKPDITHVRTPTLNYIARACEYGNAKYERANYLRSVGGVKEDFERYRGYIRALLSHAHKAMDALELHQATDPHLTDEDGMKIAMFAEDLDATKGAKVGASGLPHIAHAAASINMAITQATTYGALPDDPGQPWTDEERHKQDPDHFWGDLPND